MDTAVTNSLGSLLGQWRAVAAQEKRLAAKKERLIASLNRILPALGYRIVPVRNGPSRPAHAEAPAGAYPCPRCSRRFRLRLHLGRHVAAAHGKKAARKPKKSAA